MSTFAAAASHLSSTNSNDNQGILAIDIGTTSTKTLFIHCSGEVKATHTAKYPLYTPSPEIAEQDPEEIFAAVLEGIHHVLGQLEGGAAQAIAVCFSSAMHSLIAVDHAGTPLTRMITWADLRSKDVAAALAESDAGKAIYQATGTPIHPMSPLVKLIWMRENEYAPYREAAKLVGIKEYILHKLFGVYVMDYSIASATGLFHLQQKDWDASALKLAGITAEKLPKLVPATHQLHGLLEPYATQTGLSNVPFVIGASDGALANLGSGVMDNRRAAISIGTSSAIRAMVRKPLLEEQGRLFCYELAEGYWVAGGASNNGAVILQWVIEQLYASEAELLREQGIDPFSQLLSEAAAIDPGSNGLLFLPLLSGERAPFWNPDARGVYFGLSLSHKKAHMLRAALEGVIFQLAAISDLLEQMNGPFEEIVASGGFARSALWCQMMSDILGKRVIIPETVDSSALGAASLALFSIKKHTELAPFAASKPAAGTVYLPDASAHARYKQLLPLYLQLYEQLEPSFTTIAAYQQQQ